MRDKPFHITIGTASTKALDIQTDLHMLRAALLYADKVKLCSYTTSHVFSVFVQSKSLNYYFDYVERVVLPTYGERECAKQLEKINVYRGLSRKKHLSGEEYLALSKAKRQFAEFQADLKTRYPAITQEVQVYFLAIFWLYSNDDFHEARELWAAEAQETMTVGTNRIGTLFWLRARKVARSLTYLLWFLLEFLVPYFVATVGIGLMVYRATK